jgi:hypothetical protein
MVKKLFNVFNQYDDYLPFSLHANGRETVNGRFLAANSMYASVHVASKL